jgi:hypothetical protein
MKIVLVIAYLSMFGEPSISVHPRTDMNACRQEAATYFKRIQAGSARAWCQKIVEKQ